LRQFAVYHKFHELPSRHSTWILVGSSQRTEKCFDDFSRTVLDPYTANAFELHIIFHDVAIASWRPYLAHLHDDMVELVGYDTPYLLLQPSNLTSPQDPLSVTLRKTTLYAAVTQLTYKTIKVSKRSKISYQTSFYVWIQHLKASTLSPKCIVDITVAHSEGLNVANMSLTDSGKAMRYTWH